MKGAAMIIHRRILMRAALLSFAILSAASVDVLAQGGYPPPAAQAGPAAEGPMLGPPVVDVPGVPNALPPAQAPSSERKPRLFRLPPANKQDPAGASAADSKKVFAGRFSKRQAPTAMPAPEVSLPPGPQTDAASLPASTDPPAKGRQAPRKYGPLEFFPKPREGDRTGNPLSIKRPVLAW
jgi:hypothetical protein